MKTSILVLVLACFSSSSFAATLLVEDFESDLANWPIVGHGILTEDPLDPGNNVLSFSATHAAGDIFSIEIAVVPGNRYVLYFDYLGMVSTQSKPENLGGYIGYSDGPRDQLKWLGGTDLCDSAEVDIVDDSQWHSYSVDFSPHDEFALTFTHIRIMVEDWNGNAGQCPPDNIAGDVFFDNIVIMEYDPVGNNDKSWGAIKALYR